MENIETAWKADTDKSKRRFNKDKDLRRGKFPWEHQVNKSQLNVGFPKRLACKILMNTFPNLDHGYQTNYWYQNHTDRSHFANLYKAVIALISYL